MSGIAEIANNKMLPADGITYTSHRNGDTSDIVNEILNWDKISKADTKNFAEHLKGRNLNQTCSNIWYFIKENIEYRLDPSGVQYIKTPSKIWADRFADCKGYSIFAGSLLKNLDIPFYYRFVSYSKNPAEYTHVYVVVKDNGQTYIIDPVWHWYNKEKSLINKPKDIMTKIVNMSGVNGPARPGTRLEKRLIDLGNKDISEMNAGEMSLWIMKDRLLTERKIAAKLRGIGSLKVQRYNDALDMVTDALETVSGNLSVNEKDHELSMIAADAVSGVYNNAGNIYGIGRAKKKEKRQAKKAERKADRKERKNIKKSGDKAALKEWDKSHGTKTGRLLRKVAKDVKNVTKAVTKVVTAPQRLAVKGILEALLPKAGPFFLYLFIKDQNILAKLPAKIQNKRKRQQKIADFIVEGIGMKREHFMGIIRNGIMKQKGKSPETLISEMTKGLAGIGIIDDVIKIVVEIIGKLSKMFGKKGEAASKDDAPDESDWDGMTEQQKTEVSSEIKKQDDNTSVLPGGESGSDEGSSEESADSESGSEEKSADLETGGRKPWKSF